MPEIKEYKSLPGIRGIINKGNCCALCSCLQILMHTLPLLHLLLDTQWECIINPSNAPISRMLKAMAIHFWGAPVSLDDKGKAPPLDPSDIHEYLIINGDLFGAYFDEETQKYVDEEQHDTLEIMMHLVSRLLNEFSLLNPNPIEKMFYGLEKNEWICPMCHNIFTENSAFNHLCFPFNNCKSIEMMFKEKEEWRYFPNSDLRECPNCNNKVRVKTRSIIIKLPLVLFITVHRYTKQDHNRILDVPRILTDSTTHNQGPIEIQPACFHELYGFINHLGMDKNGHYKAHINVGDRTWSDVKRFESVLNDKWIEFNDSMYKEEMYNLPEQQLAYFYAYSGDFDEEFDLILKEKRRNK